MFPANYFDALLSSLSARNASRNPSDATIRLKPEEFLPTVAACPVFTSPDGTASITASFARGRFHGFRVIYDYREHTTDGILTRHVSTARDTIAVYDLVQFYGATPTEVHAWYCREFFRDPAFDIGERAARRRAYYRGELDRFKVAMGYATIAADALGVPELQKGSSGYTLRRKDFTVSVSTTKKSTDPRKQDAPVISASITLRVSPERLARILREVAKGEETEA